ncbi:MAG: two-component regulator propeller domain-containing protein [Phycisphaerales bacterium]
MSLFLIACAFGAADVCGQNTTSPDVRDPAYIIDTWETDEGLPENSATAMVQTSDGSLWFGTFNGLVRFDGVAFTVVNPSDEPAVSGTGVVNLYLDRAGRLWVSSHEGLSMLESGTWRRFGKEDGWVGSSARTFSDRANGDVLITTFDGNVVEYSGGRFHALPPPPPGAGQAYFGFADPEGTWCVVQNRFFGTWDGERWIALEPSLPLAASQVCAVPARDGGAWILRGTQLRKYKGSEVVTERQLPELPGNVWSLFEDARGDVWVSSYDHGLCRSGADGTFRRWDTNSGLSCNSTRFVFEDREGTHWVGTSGGGLQRFKQRRVRVYGVEDGLAERVVRSVSPAPGGDMLIATYGGGVFQERGGVVTRWPLSGLEGDRAKFVQSILTDRIGHVWVGTYEQGLWLIDQSGARHVPTEQSGISNVISLFEDSRGRIWMSGNGVIVASDGERFQRYSIEPAPKHSSARRIAEDSTGAIWLATRSGVFRLEGERFVEVKDGAGQSILDIFSMKADANGAMWMGPATGGLLRWRDARLDRVELRTGLPPSTISGMIEDDRGFWWLASGLGIVRACKADLDAVADGTQASVDCQVLDKSDGLASADCGSGNQPGCARSADGKLWFATLKGVAVLDPVAFERNETPPPVVIDAMTFEGPSSTLHRVAPQALTTDSAVPVDAGSRLLEIHYAALSFAAPEKVRFQIKLEGQDAAWRDVGSRRSAEYLQLDPGEYVFRVRAANNDGVWNESGASLRFAVLPHYWETWWFKTGVSTAFFACSSGGVWWLAHIRQRTQRRIDARARLIVEAAPNSMIMVGADGSILLANAQASRDFGYSCEELIGRPVETLLPDRFRAAHPGNKKSYFSHPTAPPMGAGRELFGRHRSGAEFPIEIGLSPIRTADGVFVLASIVNISERKRVELESLRQRNELAHLSRVAMLGELSGSLAHELNQPLTAILSNAQALQRFAAQNAIDQDEVNEILDDIVSGGKRASEVIHRLRRLLKKGDVQRQSLDLSEVVRDGLKLLRSDLINHGVQLETELVDGLPLVSGDRIQLQQVLVNLMMNGCDAMADRPANERVLRVRCAAGDEGCVRASVADSGTGIAPENLERVFESFYTTKPHGMGLGLAVCRTIIHAHDGRLWATNGPTGGACFHFELPPAAKGER